MKNFYQPGKNIPLTAPAGGVVGGTMYIIGTLPVVAAHDAAAGEEFEGVTEGVFTLPKATGAVTEGAKLYWHPGNGNLTTTATGATLVGAATKAAGASDAVAYVRLDGTSV